MQSSLERLETVTACSIVLLQLSDGVLSCSCCLCNFVNAKIVFIKKLKFQEKNQFLNYFFIKRQMLRSSWTRFPANYRMSAIMETEQSQNGK